MARYGQMGNRFPLKFCVKFSHRAARSPTAHLSVRNKPALNLRSYRVHSRELALNAVEWADVPRMLL
jgi:hypothetical protein